MPKPVATICYRCSWKTKPTLSPAKSFIDWAIPLGAFWLPFFVIAAGIYPAYAIYRNKLPFWLCQYREGTTWHMCWFTFPTDCRIAHPLSFSAAKLLPKSANNVDGLTDCVTLVSNKVKNPVQIDKNKVGILWWEQVRGSTFFVHSLKKRNCRFALVFCSFSLFEFWLVFFILSLVRQRQ